MTTECPCWLREDSDSQPAVTVFVAFVSLARAVRHAMLAIAQVYRPVTEPAGQCPPLFQTFWALGCQHGSVAEGVVFEVSPYEPTLPDLWVCPRLPLCQRVTALRSICFRQATYCLHAGLMTAVASSDCGDLLLLFLFVSCQCY